MSEKEIDRLRDATGRILDRMTAHEKECLRLHKDHQASIEGVREETARLGYRQRLIFYALGALLILELVGDGQLISWLIEHTDVGP